MKKVREWQHLDAWGMPTFLKVTQLRRVDCRRCGIRVEGVPWARKGARKTLALEREVLRQAKDSSLSAVARNLKLGWKAVLGIVRRAVAYGLARKRRNWRHLGVDEFSYGRGAQKYITTVWDHDRDEIAWVGHGKSSETLGAFFAFLGRRRTRRIRCVTLDMADAFIEEIRRKAPSAALVFDRFHIVRHLNEAVDELRKQEYWRQGGRHRDVVRGKRFLLLRHGSALSGPERGSLERLLRLNRRIARAYLLKEDFDRFWSSRSAARGLAFLWTWSTIVMRTRLDTLKRFSRMLWRHFDGVLNYFRFHLTNAPLEGQNSRTRLLSQRARGFRNPNNLIMMLYHCAGNLPLW